MNTDLKPGRVSGIIDIPPSKSFMQRICTAAYLHPGKTTVRNAGTSQDERAAIAIIRQLGAQVWENGPDLFIQGGIYSAGAASIHCSESGLSARLFTPVAALRQQPVRIEGSGSLPGRTMQFFADVLPQLGVALPGFSGHIPFTVQGPLTPRDITVDGTLSSQFISGLLFAFTTAAKEKVVLGVDGLVSKPYIDLTLHVLERFGKPVVHSGYRSFTIDPLMFVQQDDIDITVEGDWSSAAFWIAAATLGGALTIRGLNPASPQADKAIVPVISGAGGHLQWEGDLLSVRHAPLRAFEADFTDCPDLFPVMAVLAACCSGRSVLKGVHRLVHKESNRVESIAALLTLLAVNHTLEGDSLIIDGTDSFPAFRYAVPADHRMAMAAALAAFRARGSVSLSNIEAVHKSYPAFWTHIRQYCTPA